MQQDRLLVIYGREAAGMAYEIMREADIKSMLHRDMKIALKPNLVLAKPSSSGATTSPELVEGIIRYLNDNWFNHITVMESSWVGDSTEKAYKVKV